MAADQAGDRQNGVLIPDDALADPAHRHGDAVIGGAFFLNNLIGAVAHIGVDALHGLHMVVVAAQFAEMV